ncbi:MAG: hypothetical protein J7L15_04265 [Clostridiales bacterium]|nr:hypothetical protein [Clostridiales bacterium]
MKRNEYNYVVHIYESVVMNQVYNPAALKKAANIILDREYDTLIAPMRARQIIYSWYNYQREMFLNALEDVLDENGIEPSGNTQTFTEDEKTPIEEENNDLVVTEEDLIQDEIKHLEEKYAEAEIANIKRSLRMKINALKKKLDNNA